MAPRTRASSVDELVEIINQTLDEVEDFRAAIEYDKAFKGESSIIVEPVSAGLTKLLAAVDDGSYQIGQGDWLTFVDSLRDIDHRAVPYLVAVKTDPGNA
ncbi:MAG: hypothetical protein GY802_12695 [Gammaproteobacteria bacterium]|nr:hypothetical protein [Gammaproteobacteria bacterium]